MSTKKVRSNKPNFSKTLTELRQKIIKRNERVSLEDLRAERKIELFSMNDKPFWVGKQKVLHSVSTEAEYFIDENDKEISVPILEFDLNTGELRTVELNCVILSEMWRGKDYVILLNHKDLSLWLESKHSENISETVRKKAEKIIDKNQEEFPENWV